MSNERSLTDSDEQTQRKKSFNSIKKRFKDGEHALR